MNNCYTHVILIRFCGGITEKQAIKPLLDALRVTTLGHGYTESFEKCNCAQNSD